MLSPKRTYLVAFVLLFTSILGRATAEDALVITKAGYFLLVQDEQGVPSLVKLARVIKLEEPVADPVEPVDPMNPPVEQLRAAVKEATEAVTEPNKARASKGLADLYQKTSEVPVQSPQQLQVTTDVLFNGLQLPPQWTEWKVKVDKAVESFAGGDVGKWRSAWTVIADVLEPR